MTEPRTPGPGADPDPIREAHQGVLGFDRGLTSYGDPDFSRFLRGAFLASAGFDADDHDRPVIGLADTSSGYTTCHRSMGELLDAVERGVLEAGGLPVRFPTMSLPEILLSPTSMLFRNLAAMELEEQLAALPMDAVVLAGGCDKTVPAQLMAAASSDRPAVSLVVGPMQTGSWRGEPLGACTDCRRLWAEHRAGNLDEKEIAEAQGELCPTAGTCMVMGTASTMACLAEALGLMPPGGATPPAPTGDRLRVATRTGRVAVDLAREGVPSRQLLSAASFDNAATVLAAIGGSTNAVIHLLAIARRCGIDLTLDTLGQRAAEVPVLVDCKPAGSGYLADFDRAGGLPALMGELRRAGLLELGARVVEGGTVGDRLDRLAGNGLDHPRRGTCAIRSTDDPVHPPGGLRVLRGSLAPDGAVLKASAATIRSHEGPAVVFESVADAEARLDDPDLPVTAESVLVLRGAGPVGAGMPEAGSLPIPRRLAEQGVCDMVRVSDGRMSGTAYGTVVLHVSPEAAIGGPLALVRDGDRIRLDVDAGRLDLLVEPAELERRRAAWEPPAVPERGWRRLHALDVLPAHLGADLGLMAPDHPATEED
jgi:dihydroxy-acid dehydratase